MNYNVSTYWPGFSDREVRCLAGYAKGYTIHQIAEKLHCTTHTVTANLHKARKKLDAANSANATYKFMRRFGNNSLENVLVE